eukprot:ctg_172.g104
MNREGARSWECPNGCLRAGERGECVDASRVLRSDACPELLSTIAGAAQARKTLLWLMKERTLIRSGILPSRRRAGGTIVAGGTAAAGAGHTGGAGETTGGDQGGRRLCRVGAAAIGVRGSCADQTRARSGAVVAGCARGLRGAQGSPRRPRGATATGAQAAQVVGGEAARYRWRLACVEEGWACSWGGAAAWRFQERNMGAGQRDGEPGIGLWLRLLGQTLSVTTVEWSVKYSSPAGPFATSSLAYESVMRTCSHKLPLWTFAYEIFVLHRALTGIAGRACSSLGRCRAPEIWSLHHAVGARHRQGGRQRGDRAQVFGARPLLFGAH